MPRGGVSVIISFLNAAEDVQYADNACGILQSRACRANQTNSPRNRFRFRGRMMDKWIWNADVILSARGLRQAGGGFGDQMSGEAGEDKFLPLIRLIAFGSRMAMPVRSFTLLLWKKSRHAYAMPAHLSLSSPQKSRMILSFDRGSFLNSSCATKYTTMSALSKAS